MGRDRSYSLPILLDKVALCERINWDTMLPWRIPARAALCVSVVLFVRNAQ